MMASTLVSLFIKFKNLLARGVKGINVSNTVKDSGVLELKVLATIPYFNFHFFPHLLIFLQFRDPSCVLNLSTKAVLQKWHN